MKIDIYQSTKNPMTFLSVPAGLNVEKLSLSETDADYFSEVSVHRKALSIDASDRRIAMDAADIIFQIQEQGYAVHSVEVRFTEST